MSAKLLEAMKTEMNVWKLCYPYQRLADDYVCFYYPDYPLHPHWNIAYPTRIQNLTPSPEDIQNIAQLFSSLKVTGHYYSTSTEPSKNNLIVSSDEYFEYSPKSSSVTYPDKKVQWKQTNDLALFSSIVCDGFNIDGQGRAQFLDKMTLIQSRINSYFYILVKDEVPLGAISLFEGAPNSFFVMNFTISKPFRNHGLSYSIELILKIFEGKQIVTHSNSSILMTTVLPKLNWKSLGKVYVYKF